MLTIGSLFSGIGGLESGLERALGAETRWQVEIDPFARSVLEKHWPKARRYEDVRTVGAANLERVDVVCGGFPCVDLSPVNHRGRGLGGDVSGPLWSEFARIVAELGPRIVVVENAGMAWREWVPTVRRDLWCAGFATVPLHISAVSLGARHDRNRCFVVADADFGSESALAKHAPMALLRATARARRTDWWHPPSRTLGVADGVASRMDRLHAAGNAVMPAMSEAIGYVVADVLASLGSPA